MRVPERLGHHHQRRPSLTRCGAQVWRRAWKVAAGSSRAAALASQGLAERASTLSRQSPVRDWESYSTSHWSRTARLSSPHLSLAVAGRAAAKVNLCYPGIGEQCLARIGESVAAEVEDVAAVGRGERAAGGLAEPEECCPAPPYRPEPGED